MRIKPRAFDWLSHVLRYVEPIVALSSATVNNNNSSRIGSCLATSAALTARQHVPKILGNKVGPRLPGERVGAVAHSAVALERLEIAIRRAVKSDVLVARIFGQIRHETRALCV